MMGVDDEVVPAVLAGWVEWCRSGEPQRRARARRARGDRPRRAYMVCALCVVCGNGCRPRGDGLCWRCRQKRRYREDADYRTRVRDANRTSRAGLNGRDVTVAA